LAARPAAWATGPAIALSPYENHPNSTTQVLGNGFSPYAAVDIYFDSTDEALAIANSAGKFAKNSGPCLATAPSRHALITASSAATTREPNGRSRVNTDWAISFQ